MRRRSFIGIVAVVMCLAVPANSQVDRIAEEFDGPLGDGWYSEGAAVRDGALTVTDGAQAFLLTEFADVDVRLIVRRLGDGTAWFVYRRSGANMILVRIGAPIEVFAEIEGSPIAHHPSGFPLPPGEEIILEVSAIGDRHVISVDETALIEFTLGEPATGTIGFITEPGGGVAVSRLEWSVPSESTPADEPVDPETLRWVRTGGPLGGLGYDVRMRPGDPDTMLVTDAYAGVFSSTDGGSTWEPSNEGITVRTGPSGDGIPVFCLTIDPHDPNVVWAGAQFKRGIFRSDDGGRTWAEMDDGVVEAEGITFRGFTVDPKDPNTVYAAAELSSWARGGEPRNGREFDMTSGVVYRTTDRGRSWSAAWRGDNLARYVWVDPTDTGVVYVSTGIFDREAANSDPQAGFPGGVGVIKSIDGGASWSTANTGLANLYVGSLFMHPHDPSVLLAGTGSVQYYAGNGVYLTTDGAASWTHTLAGENIHSVEFALSDPDIAYAAGDANVYRSVDGGRTWIEMTDGEGWGPSGVRAGFPIDLQVDPRDPDRVFVNNYGGGNFVSRDGGRSWQVASTGYTGAQARGIAVDPEAPARVYAAARSGMFVSEDGGTSWTGLSTPPEFVLEWNAVAVDPADPRHLLAGNNWDAVFLESTDGAETWRRRGADLAGPFGARVFAFAPSDPRIVYAGTGGYVSAGSWANDQAGAGIWLSGDGGATWRKAPDERSVDANVADIAVHPHDPARAVAAASDRGLLRTDDGGETWPSIGTSLPSKPLSIAYHPEEPDVMLVGLEFGAVFRSDDGGETWRRSSAGLNPEAVVTDIVFGSRGDVYLADLMSGVYRSSDAGETWTALDEGLRTRAVNALGMSGDGLHLYAATDGEGVFRLDLGGAPPVPVPQAEDPEPSTTTRPPPPDPVDPEASATTEPDVAATATTVQAADGTPASDGSGAPTAAIGIGLAAVAAAVIGWLVVAVGRRRRLGR